jgi:hypothetical protein
MLRIDFDHNAMASSAQMIVRSRNRHECGSIHSGSTTNVFFLLFCHFYSAFRIDATFQHSFTLCLHLCGSDVADSRILQYTEQNSARGMDDIVRLDEGSQGPSTQVPLDMDGEFEAEFGYDPAQGFMASAAARGAVHARRGSNSARSTSTPSQS